jgi:hypothetical protein
LDIVFVPSEVLPNPWMVWCNSQRRQAWVDLQISGITT